MSIPTKRLDSLDPTFTPDRDHEVAAMRDGVSNKLRVEQILALLQTSDIPDAAVTLANLADDARDASNHTFDDTTAQLGETDVQGAIEAVALGYRLRGARIKIEESGTYTPDAEVKAVLVEVQGAGGSGGGAQTTGANEASGGAGGGSGGLAQKLIVDPAPATITIGAGGAASSVRGNSGGDTTYVDGTNTIVGNGGRGGRRRDATTAINTAPKGQGGDATGGDINVSGEPGGALLVTGSAGPRGFAGNGGSSKFGGGGRGAANNAASARVEGGSPNSASYGAGSGGAYNTSSVSFTQSGDAADGVVIIWEFI